MLTRIAIFLLLVGGGAVLALRDGFTYAISNGGFLLLNHGLALPPADGMYLQQAERWLEHAEAEGNGRRVQSGLGLIYHTQNQPAQALAAWQAAGLNADQFLVWAQRAWAENRYQEARVWLQYATAVDPLHPESYYWRGRIDNASGQFATAASELQQALKLKPSQRDIWYELAQTYQGQRNWAAAHQALKKAAQADETYGLIGRSNILYESGYIQQHHLDPVDLDGAWQAYEQALQAADYVGKLWQTAHTHYQRGLLLAGQEQWNSARLEYEEALALNPEAYAVQISYARTLWQLSFSQQAESILRRAIGAQPARFEAMVALGDLYRWEDDLDAAREWYLRASELAPTNLTVQERIEALKLTVPEQ